MKQQAQDFRDECDALAAILEPLNDDDFDAVTQFKGWSINDVLGHLHMFNVAADLSIESDDLFLDFFAKIAARMSKGATMLQAQYPFLDGLSGHALFTAWKGGCDNLADNFSRIDPKIRLKWAGPDMSARSSVTARQMETWAHGNEVFDLLGVARKETDRLKNIVHLGVSTYKWAFINRQQTPPEPAPWINLTAPSGDNWQWNDRQLDNSVSGAAVEFAQVVTQGRNIDDTALILTGQTAKDWMKIAQCFAGEPQTPPQMGTRFSNLDKVT